jgi:hypothetical protein
VNHVITHRAGLVHNSEDPFRLSLGELQTSILNASRRRAAMQVLRQEYVESVLRYGTGQEHFEYEPIFFTAVDESGRTVQRYKYAFENSPEFEISVDTPFNVTQITGRDLRLKTTQEEIGGRRGVTERTGPGNQALMVNASHLIADRFMGSGFQIGGNLIDASEYYNQVVMAAAEDRIEGFIREIARLEASGRIEDVTFDLEVTARWGPFIAASALRLIIEQILERHAPENTDARAALRDEVTTHATNLISRGRSARRVMGVKYELKVVVRGDRENARELTCEIGPDIYMGLDRSKVGAILDRPGPTGSPSGMPETNCS